MDIFILSDMLDQTARRALKHSAIQLKNPWVFACVMCRKSGMTIYDYWPLVTRDAKKSIRIYQNIAIMRHLE